jgi:hypothetical protein
MALRIGRQYIKFGLLVAWHSASSGVGLRVTANILNKKFGQSIWGGTPA